MESFREARTLVWTFLEAYGWICVFAVVLAYVLYKKYIYDLWRAQNEEKRLREQKKFDVDLREKHQEKMAEVRRKQQEQHDEVVKLEKAKKLEKEKEEAERRLKELESSTDKLSFVLGHSESSNKLSIDLIDNLAVSASIVIFGNSNCPDFRKSCQLIATYRLDASKIQIFEIDKQKSLPVEQVESMMKEKYGLEKSPFIFINGKFVGGLAEARIYDKDYGFNKI